MEWSKSKTLELIECYKGYGHLWDNKHKFYKHRLLRIQAFKEMAVKFDMPVQEIERKLKNLNSHFIREWKCIHELRMKDTSKWFGYKPMSLLMKFPKKLASKPDIAEEHVEADPVQKRKRKPMTRQKTHHVPETDMPSSSKQTENNTNHNESVTKTDLLHIQEMIKSLKQRDEYDLCGEQIALKLRNMKSPIARVFVQNKINTLFMEAELGLYDSDPRYEPEFYEEPVDVMIKPFL